jgi:hypothetical protein
MAGSYQVLSHGGNVEVACDRNGMERLPETAELPTARKGAAINRPNFNARLLQS